MDIWEALVGAPPEGPEQTKMIADQLRRDNQYGVLGQITGDATLSPTGKGLQERAMEKGKTMQKARLSDLQRQLTGGYYKELERQHNDRMEYQKKRDPEKDQLARDLAQIAASSRRNQMQSDLWRYRQNLGRDIVKAGLPEIEASISTVDEALKPYEGKNIPGFGAGKYDRRDEARALRGKLAGIENILLKARSGAAVTEPEYERFRKELLGEGVFASDADFRRSWEDLKSRINAHKESIFQTYDPIVVEYYLSDESLPGKGGESRSNSVRGPAYKMMPADPATEQAQRDFEREYGLGSEDD